MAQHHLLLMSMYVTSTVIIYDSWRSSENERDNDMNLVTNENADCQIKHPQKIHLDPEVRAPTYKFYDGE